MNEPTLYRPATDAEVGEYQSGFANGVRRIYGVPVEPDYQAAINELPDDWRVMLAGLQEIWIVKAVVDAALGIGGDHGR